MKVYTVLAVIVLLLAGINDSYALDWKRLHQEAQQRDLGRAEFLVKESPQSVEELYVLGLIYLDRHKIEKAKETFLIILQFHPESIEAKWGLAEVLRCQHELEKSEKILSQVIKKEPDFAPAYISYAYIRYTQSKYPEALRFANTVASMGLDKVDINNYVRANLIVGGTKGMIAHFGGPLAKIRHGLGAFSYLKKAEDLSPDSAQVYFGLGAFYLLAPSPVGGDLDKALDYLQKAVDKDPLLADAYVRLAQVYKRKGNKDVYRLYMEKALRIDPKNELALDIKSGKCKFICFP